LPGNDTYESLERRAAEYTGPHADLVAKTPDFYLLLHRLLSDRRVSTRYKGLFAQSLAYMTAPLEVLDEAWTGKATVVDDICVAVAPLKLMTSCLSTRIIDDHWHGSYDVHETVDHLLTNADKLIGKGRLRLILESVGSFMSAKEKFILHIEGH
jgi:hypothetical protein